MKKLLIVLVVAFFANTSNAQIDLKKIINLDDVIGKVLSVKKGYAPSFSLGNTPFKKITKVAEIIGLKKNADANRLFNTFKTGRTIYRVAQYIAAGAAVYGGIKAVDKAANAKDYQTAIWSALGTSASGLITKFLTKGASYKAVDVFNGVIKKKLKDILSVAPASNTMGMGVYVKL